MNRMDLQGVSRRTLLAAGGALLIAPQIGAAPAQAPVVDTPTGRIRGSFEPDGTLVFRGIPYATAPARFQAPAALAPWPGIFDATGFGPTCPQPPELVGVASEIASLFD